MTFFVMCSMLPSLLARPPLLQGVATGLSAIVGYGIGLGLSAAIRWFVGSEAPDKYKKWAWLALKIIAPLALTLYLILGFHWQNEVRSALEVEYIGIGYVFIEVIVAVAVFVILLLIGRGIRLFSNFLNYRFKKRLPLRIAVASSIIITGYLVYVILSGVLASTFFRVMDNSFGARDKRVPEGNCSADQ